MVRWDSPLFTVPWTEDQPPLEEIWQAVTAGTLKPPNAGTSSVRINDECFDLNLYMTTKGA